MKKKKKGIQEIIDTITRAVIFIIVILIVILTPALLYLVFGFWFG